MSVITKLPFNVLKLFIIISMKNVKIKLINYFFASDTNTKLWNNFRFGS